MTISQPGDRRLSLLTPSGHLTLGNHLGALRGMAAAPPGAASFYGLSDLHAMTTAHDPTTLAASTREMQTLLLACGLDPDRATLFRQSLVPAHTELAYLLECTAYVGELGRMIQYKEKGRGRPQTRTSLLTYPVLMAADILLYRPSQVPVGEDQRQHVELSRDLAMRFNREYGAVFTVPEITVPPAAARVRDLQDPTRKMSKSDPVGAGVVFLLDPPDVVARKVARAVTDSDTGPDAACTGVPLAEAGADVSTYGQLKKVVTEAVLSVLEPLQARYAELADDPGYVDGVFAAGSERCRVETAPVLAAARAAMGLGQGLG